jgi:hypothetical protein
MTKKNEESNGDEDYDKTIMQIEIIKMVVSIKKMVVMKVERRRRDPRPHCHYYAFLSSSLYFFFYLTMLLPHSQSSYHLQMSP